MSFFQTGNRNVLAIDPITRGFGFVVMEGLDFIIDWGVKETKTEKEKWSFQQVEKLMDYYRPDVLVVEDCRVSECKRCFRIRQFIEQIILAISSRNIEKKLISQQLVKEIFARVHASNKHQIASVIVKQIPELSPYLPPCRKCWMPEDSRYAIFDAAAFALTYYYLEQNRQKQSNR